MKTDTLRRLYPRVARAFDLYLLCRTQQLFHLEVKKNGGKSVEHRVVRFTTGFHALPEAGGLLDQPVWTMEMFERFKSGENLAASKALNK